MMKPDQDISDAMQRAELHAHLSSEAELVLSRFSSLVVEEARVVLTGDKIATLAASSDSWLYVVELAAVAGSHLLGPLGHSICWSQLVRAVLDPLDLMLLAYGDLRLVAEVLSTCIVVRKRRNACLKFDRRGGSGGCGAGAVLSTAHLGKILLNIERRIGVTSNQRAQALAWERNLNMPLSISGRVDLAVQRVRRFQMSTSDERLGGSGVRAQTRAPLHTSVRPTPPRQQSISSDTHPVTKFGYLDGTLG